MRNVSPTSIEISKTEAEAFTFLSLSLVSVYTDLRAEVGIAKNGKLPLKILSLLGIFLEEYEFYHH